VSDSRLGGALSVSSFGSVRRAIAVGNRLWLHVLLFALTLLTTTAFGFGLNESYRLQQPLKIEALLQGYERIAHLDTALWSGLYFSGPLLLVLLAHEFGHYVACLQWRVQASLPYFLPSPTLLGTLGAFIRIRSPIYTRAALFDIGFAGPIAGFCVLLPFLFAGIHLSFAATRPGNDTLVLGTPLLMQFAERLQNRFASSQVVVFHPFAVAAWAGLLATAVNLLPLGQLDGGHIVYAVFGARWHRIVSVILIVAMVVLGFLYWAWWAWAIAMYFLGRRHPLVYDEAPLSHGRRWLAVLALILFVLSLSLVPVTVA
jgi:membrane-associated protease RseP (regulator of RpoE activity)